MIQLPRWIFHTTHPGVKNKYIKLVLRRILCGESGEIFWRDNRINRIKSCRSAGKGFLWHWLAMVCQFRRRGWRELGRSTGWSGLLSKIIQMIAASLPSLCASPTLCLLSGRKKTVHHKNIRRAHTLMFLPFIKADVFYKWTFVPSCLVSAP